MKLFQCAVLKRRIKQSFHSLQATNLKLLEEYFHQRSDSHEYVVVILGMLSYLLLLSVFLQYLHRA